MLSQAQTHDSTSLATSTSHHLRPSRPQSPFHSPPSSKTTPTSSLPPAAPSRPSTRISHPLRTASLPSPSSVVHPALLPPSTPTLARPLPCVHHRRRKRLARHRPHAHLAEHDVLACSHVNHGSIIARRGPLEAAFTTKELRELMNLPDASMLVPRHLLSVPQTMTMQQSRIPQLLQKGPPMTSISDVVSRFLPLPCASRGSSGFCFLFVTATNLSFFYGTHARWPA